MNTTTEAPTTPAPLCNLRYFEDVSNPALCFFAISLNATQTFLLKYRFLLAILSLLVNLFHISILVRKSVRNNCINVILLGIAIADCLIMIQLIYNKISESLVAGSCFSRYTFWPTLLGHWTLRASETSRLVSSMLGVLISLIRVLVVKNAMNSKFDSISTSIFGFKCVAIVSIFWSLETVWFWFNASINKVNGASWTPKPVCGFPENYSAPVYQYKRDDGLWPLELELPFNLHVTLGGAASILPAIALPILTVMLVQELRKAGILRTRFSQNINESAKTRQTTKMILLMTVTTMIAEGPIGISRVLISFWISTQETFILSYLESIFTVVVYFNTLSHCIICICLSSQYRDTVAALFICRLWKRNGVRPIRVAPNESVAASSRGPSNNIRFE